MGSWRVARVPLGGIWPKVSRVFGVSERRPTSLVGRLCQAATGAEFPPE